MQHLVSLWMFWLIICRNLVCCFVLWSANFALSALLSSSPFSLPRFWPWSPSSIKCSSRTFFTLRLSPAMQLSLSQLLDRCPTNFEQNFYFWTFFASGSSSFDQTCNPHTAMQTTSTFRTCISLLASCVSESSPALSRNACWSHSCRSSSDRGNSLPGTCDQMRNSPCTFIWISFSFGGFNWCFMVFPASANFCDILSTLKCNRGSPDRLYDLDTKNSAGLCW